MRAAAKPDAASLLGIRANGTGELDRIIQRGLPKASLQRLYRAIEPGGRSIVWSKFQQMVVSRASWKRREKLLSASESAKTERLARVAVLAIDAWDGNETYAREWLWTPHQELDDKAPILVAMTELGARRVEQVLASISYGLPV